MSISCHCPNGHPVEAENASADSCVSCPKCGTTFHVPTTILPTERAHASEFGDPELVVMELIEPETVEVSAVADVTGPELNINVFAGFIECSAFSRERIFWVTAAGGMLGVMILMALAFWLAPTGAVPRIQRESVAKVEPAAEKESRPLQESGNEFHVTGIALSPNGKQAVLWGGRPKDVQNYLAACGPPYQIAVFDTATSTILESRTLANPVVRADIDSDTICALMLNPSDYGDRERSGRPATLVRFSADLLQPEAFVNVVARGDSVEMISDKFVVIDATQRFSLTELKPLGRTKASDEHWCNGRWIWEDALWDADLQNRVLLMSVGEQDWPCSQTDLRSKTLFGGLPVGFLVSTEDEVVKLVSKNLVDGGVLGERVVGRLDAGRRAPDQSLAVSESLVAVLVNGTAKLFKPADLTYHVTSRVRIDAAQSTLSLNPTELNSVKYFANLNCRFKLEIRVDRDSDPIFVAESDTGEFEIDLTNISATELLGIHSAEHSNSEYNIRSAIHFQKLIGRAPNGIATALLATVVAESSDGQTDTLEHQYLLDVPNPTDNRNSERVASEKFLKPLPIVDEPTGSTPTPTPGITSTAKNETRETDSENIPVAANNETDSLRIETFSTPDPIIDPNQVGFVRFLKNDDGTRNTAYLPSGINTRDADQHQIQIDFPGGRGFPLARRIDEHQLEQITFKLEEQKIIADIERFQGLGRLTFTGLCKPDPSVRSPIIKQIFWSTDGDSAFILNAENRLFKVSLKSWMIERAVQFPSETLLQPCPYGLVALCAPHRLHYSNRDAWIDLVNQPQDNPKCNVLYLLSESDFNVLAASRTTAISVYGHCTSPILLTQDPSVLNYAVIDVGLWEMIDCIELKMGTEDLLNRHASAQGCVALRGITAEQAKDLTESIQADIDRWKQSNDLIAYSESGSKVMVSRKKFYKVLLCDADDLGSFDKFLPDLPQPTAMALHAGQGSFYVGFSSGVCVVRNGTKASVEFAKPAHLQLWTGGSGKGAFVLSGDNLYWLQPIAGAPRLSDFQRLISCPEVKGEAANENLPIDSIGTSKPMFEFVAPESPLNALTSFELSSLSRNSNFLKPPGVEYFNIAPTWYEWDPDGQHCYVFSRQEKQLICIDTLRNQEIKRLTIPDQPSGQARFYLTQSEILVQIGNDLASIAYKTLNPLWRISYQDSSSQLDPIHAHPSHPYITCQQRALTIFIDPRTGEVVKQLMPEDVEDYTDGVLMMQVRSGAKKVQRKKPVPENHLYEPQGFRLLWESNTFQRKGLYLQHESEQTARPFPAHLPLDVSRYKPHPKTPFKLLAMDSKMNILVILDCDQVGQ